MDAIATEKRKFLPKFSTYAGVVLAASLSLVGVKAGVSTLVPKAHPAIPDQKNNAGKKTDASSNTPAKKRHWYEFGRASWYGGALQGQQTASGESFDMNELTCAHRSLPLGSLIRVTNLRNHKTVVVRVNDRGPMLESRIVDLSYAAARFLGFSNRGTAPVRLELVNPKSNVARMNDPLPATGN